MSDTFEVTNWRNYFKEFSKQNLNRPAKLETINQLGLEKEVDWVPLKGIGLELRGDGAPRIEIIFGSPDGEFNHYTHFIEDVDKIFGRGQYVSPDALDFEAEDGSKVILTLSATRAMTSGA